MIRAGPAAACCLVVGLGLASACERGPSSGTETASEESPPVVPATALDSLVVQADEAYWDGEFGRAREIYQIALAKAGAESNRTVEAEVLTSLGLAAWRLGDYAEARDRGEAGLALKLDLGLDELLFRSYNALGLLAWNEGRLAEAAELFGKASDAALAVGDAEGLAKATNNQGLVNVELGEFRRSREAFRTTLEAARSIENPTIEASALSNLGMLDIRVGDPAAAIPTLREARRIFQLVDDAFYEQNTLGQLGHAYTALGEPRLAFAALDTALARSRETGLRQEEASNLELIADLYRIAGDHRRALDHHEQARTLNETLGLEVERGSNLRSEAEIYVELGDHGRARDLASSALAIHEAAGASYEALGDLLLVAEIDARTGRMDAAEGELRAARRTADRLSARSARIEVALSEARIADHSRAFERVVRVVRQVRSDLDTGSYATRAEAERLLARAYAGLGMPDSAAAAGLRAVAALERMRSRYGSAVLKTTFVADRSEVYAELVDVLLGLGEVDEAFEIADGARGRALLEHLVSSRTREHGRGSVVRSLAEGEELLLQIDALVERLDEIEAVPPEQRTPALEEAVDRIAEKLVETRSRYESLLVTASERDAGGVTMLGGRVVGARDVQSALGPDEALVTYLVTADRLRIFVVTREAIRSLEHEIAADDLASRVRLARDLAADPGFEAGRAPPVLQGLHGALIAPVIRSGALHRARRIVLVPHGVLNYLPFAALVDPVTGRYLIEDFELALLPSSSVLAVLRNPDLRPGAERAGGSRPHVFAPFPDRLPATGREAEAVDRSLRGARVLRGRRATEIALLEALEDGGIVHVATHGVMNARNPMFSRIEMAGDGSGRGRLEVHEIVTARIRSPLVFLSGCETGVGTAWSTTFDRGEDYATLSKALLYAGARDVIATLWRIEDAGAAELAGRFYEHLERLPPSAALAKAQRSMIAEDRYRSPFYWAGYQLSGTGD